MVKSVLGKYGDMVAMVPITNIKSSIIKQYYMNVLEVVIKVGLEPVATITDTHASNRKLYVDKIENGIFPEKCNADLSVKFFPRVRSND
uniref:Putative LOC100207826 [Hydra vulgaris] n=1 Tax=Lepeophtheirus salmonis TaxID=72036 RepID=A0A0K2V1S8_LEPSM